MKNLNSEKINEIINKLSEIPTSIISDVMGRIYGTKNIKPYYKGKRLVGRALTVKTRPGDNLYLYKALTMVNLGEVIVIDGAGDSNNAILGEIIKEYAMQVSCAGFVVDGAIRDTDAFENDSFPCFARSHTHRGPYKNGPGEISVDICIDGQVVHHGDIVVGDEDGVVFIPISKLEKVLLDSIEKIKVEIEMINEIKTGNKEQSWLNSFLEKEGIK